MLPDESAGTLNASWGSQERRSHLKSKVLKSGDSGRIFIKHWCNQEFPGSYEVGKSSILSFYTLQMGRKSELNAQYLWHLSKRIKKALDIFFARRFNVKTWNFVLSNEMNWLQLVSFCMCFSVTFVQGPLLNVKQTAALDIRIYRRWYCRLMARDALCEHLK